MDKDVLFAYQTIDNMLVLYRTDLDVLRERLAEYEHKHRLEPHHPYHGAWIADISNQIREVEKNIDFQLDMKARLDNHPMSQVR